MNILPDYVLVKGFPAYRLYSNGKIESRWRSGHSYDGFSKPDRWFEPKTKRKDGGYMQMTLKDGLGRSRQVYIHKLVAEEFIGPSPFVGAIVRHLDGNPFNNDYQNLAWGSYKDNEDDKKRHGTWWLRMGGAKVNQYIVSGIRQEFMSGKTQDFLAEKHKVSRPTITRICNGTTWK